jgi:DNA-binding protein HU-beta
MLASIAISALLAGPAVAGLIPRQNTLTVTQISTSTHSVYSPADKTTILPFTGTGTGVKGAVTLAPGINPLNGMPAAPPVRPSNVTDVTKSSTTIRPIVMTTINGTLKAIYKTGPASTFAIPHRSSGSKPSASASAPIFFHTYTPTSGVKVTATNSPSAVTGLPPKYSALSQAPPKFAPTSSAESSPRDKKKPSTTSTSSFLDNITATAPASTQTSTVVITATPNSSIITSVITASAPSSTTESSTSAAAPPATTKSTTSAAPATPAPEPTKLSTKENPYPYPTPDPEQPKTSSVSTKWTYPYPTM